MKYNHTDNAGNKADIWKHEILLKTVAAIRPKTYFETHCGYPFYNKGRVWLSSYMKVRTEFKCDMVVCDIDERIADEIPAGIVFRGGTGWVTITEYPQQDFYFIDPPYLSVLDMEMLKALLCNSKFRQPLIAWYPIFASPEIDRYDFNLPVIEHMFTDGKLLGCGMVFKNIPEHIVDGLR